MALKRKFLALELPNGDHFDPQDEGALRNLIVTLEDLKIRHYKIEDRTALRDLGSDSWPATFTQYLTQLECPYAQRQWQTVPEDRLRVVDWLLGYAISLEYHDNASIYNAAVTGVSSNTDVLSSIDTGSEECLRALQQVAAFLNIPKLDTVQLQWRAVAKTVQAKFTPSQITAAKATLDQPTLDQSLSSMPLGFDTGDEVLNQAAKVLRLLHVAELRVLQTQVNELIVSVQNITADPKTDSRLGKVGR
eukprot:m.24008 g.24008  ORF g.24008 m.24008 type:complete len:248 (-) comp11463_c0_seq1:73-816(-)